MNFLWEDVREQTEAETIAPSGCWADLGRRSMTADVAMRLARYFGTSATVWMGLQTEYDLNLAAANRDIQKIKPREAA